VYSVQTGLRVVTQINALRTTLTKRDLLPRVGRWWLTVVYRPDCKMTHVDALSRNPVEQNVAIDDIDLVNINISEDDWLLAA
jgi:hypothetical protein